MSSALRTPWLVTGLNLALVLGLTVFLLWPASPVFLVLFAATLFALLVDGLAAEIRHWVSIPELAARLFVLLLMLLSLTLFMLMAGPRLADQMSELSNRLPEAVDQLRSAVSEPAWAGLPKDWGAEQLQPRGTEIVDGITGVFSTAFGAIANVFVVFFIGLYLALSPNTYLQGGLHLIPRQQRERAKAVLDALGHALRGWLVGRFASMAAVGILTTAGLAIINLPLALVLGVIAGIVSFVPYLGPIAAAIPALLIGLLESPLMALYVLGIYSLVQFLEGNFITPLVQRRVVSLPPAVLLSAQFALGYFYGLFGVLLATPLAVVAIVLIQMLYVQDVLEDPIQVLGARGDDS